MNSFSIRGYAVSLVCLIVFLAVFVQHKNSQLIDYHSLDLKVDYLQFTSEIRKELTCLAENIYFEARGEPFEGMLAVAFVTMNRVNSKEYPNTICGVVKQRNTRVCQFSWWCEATPKSISEGRKLTIDSNRVYNDIMNLAVEFYVKHERLYDPTYGALFYHANYVQPNWRNVKKTTQIGKHIFYRISR